MVNLKKKDNMIFPELFFFSFFKFWAFQFCKYNISEGIIARGLKLLSADRVQ